jgi:hypothetical protein
MSRVLQDGRELHRSGRANTLDDVEWSLPNVLEFMTNTFHVDKIVSPVEMASLLASLEVDLLSHSSHQACFDVYRNLHCILFSLGVIGMSFAAAC